MIRFSLVLLPFFIFNSALAIRWQPFLGVGQQINTANLITQATNQMTRNTTSVRAGGQFYQSQTQHGSYYGSAQDITSGYVGVEISDDLGILAFRGYASASYSYATNIGSLEDVRGGDLPACSTSAQSDCFRDSFFTSQGNSSGQVSSVPFNKNPSFVDSISNVFYITYGIGADISLNIPISFFLNKMTSLNVTPIRLGFFGGIGYEFSTLSIGFYDKRVFNNTTVDNVVINANDTFYLAGGGWFIRYGFSLWVTNHLRLDIAAKLSYADMGSSRFYSQESTDTTVMVDSVYKQQVLVQQYNSQLQWVWNFAFNVLF